MTSFGRWKLINLEFRANRSSEWARDRENLVGCDLELELPPRQNGREMALTWRPSTQSEVSGKYLQKSYWRHHICSCRINFQQSQQTELSMVGLSRLFLSRKEWWFFSGMCSGRSCSLRKGRSVSTCLCTPDRSCLLFLHYFLLKMSRLAVTCASRKAAKDSSMTWAVGTGTALVEACPIQYCC